MANITSIEVMLLLQDTDLRDLERVCNALISGRSVRVDLSSILNAVSQTETLLRQVQAGQISSENLPRLAQLLAQIQLQISGSDPVKLAELID